MPERHALIIGIDRYPRLDPQYQLAGCVNDATLVRQILSERFGFAAERIQSLHDEQASRSAILAAMERLVEQVGTDDTVHIHFSGHGSRRTAAGSDESSGKDSTLMPSDSGRSPHPNLDIVDDEIGEWLARLAQRTRAISLLIDCCHSGTITRDPFGSRIRAAPDDPRSLVEMGLAESPGSARRGSGGNPALSWAALSDAWVVMSGCRDTEYAHEFSERRGAEVIRHGALTHFFMGALLAAPTTASFRDLFEIAQRQVSARFPSQHPQIEGARDRVLFATDERVPLRYVSLISEQDGTVTLAGGAAHGLHPGARWAVYPPGTRDTTSETALAELEISEVGVLSSKAARKGSGPPLPLAARCVELRPGTGQFRLGVDLSSLPDADRQQLSAAVDASPLLRAAPAEEASFAIRRAPAAQDTQAEVWSVRDSAGSLSVPDTPCDEDDAVGRLIGNLETWARYRNALTLDNPASRIRVSFRLLREVDGAWQPMTDGDRLQAGDSVAFELVNHEDRPLFVSVLDFGLTGRIQLLYPPNSSSEPIAAGRTLRVGCDRRRIRLGLPAGFAADSGRETFKAMVTLDETDFSWLQQGGTRSLGMAAGPLRRLFAAALDGPLTRDAMLEDDADDAQQDWRALQQSFVLSRSA